MKNISLFHIDTKYNEIKDIFFITTFRIRLAERRACRARALDLRPLLYLHSLRERNDDGRRAMT